jgi:hypothetical protein
VFALQQAELLFPYARLRAYRSPRVFSTAFAMAMSRTNEWRLDFEPDSTAEATPTDFLGHTKFCNTTKPSSNLDLRYACHAVVAA